MKKIFLVGAVALFGALNAQSFGVKAGMNISSVSNFEEASSKVGLNAGVFMNAPIAENLSIQPELLYNSKGVKWDFGSEGSGSTVGNYLSIPVMFQYNAMPNFYLEAGPEFSFLVSAKDKWEGESEDVKDEFNGFDLGIGLGLGYYFTPNVGVNARYVAGFTDIMKNNDTDDTYKNNVFQIGLSYKFGK